MSQRPKYTLSPQAQQRLQQIRGYTDKHYGEDQRKGYFKSLRVTMLQISKNPLQEGRARKDLKEGYYSIKADKDIIYYRVKSSLVEIIDVLHQSMEPSQV